ncbi:MAG: 4Fe-4S dicluster domain-containing protein [Candidatus Lambdaproteobacteria bacterium]|nr:4Fe-4S dicluster domain-containing protein [Candidatus Lambdaproteobacteria bacterium]
MFKKIRYVMAIETAKCVGCGACVFACKQENDVPVGFARDWVEQEVHGTYPVLSMENRSQRCQHCDRPPCVYACPTGASHVGPGGITLVDGDLCTGCKACIAACPYDARYVTSRGVVDKCTFCAHRVAQGMEPACVAVCPTSCLHFGDANDPNGEVAGLLATRRHRRQKTHLGTEPQLYWLD